MSHSKKYGIHDGKLRPCQDSPNCVCSESSGGDSTDGHAIEPLTFTGDADVAWSRLRAVLAVQPRTTIVENSDGYLQARAITWLLRFEDVLEFRLDRAASAIQVRSASRIGYWDLGVNRRRVDTIRRQFSSS